MTDRKQWATPGSRRLGGKGEIPFALGAGASALEANAAGSAAVRLGAPVRPTSPLDAWLEVLFGAGG